MTPLMGSFESLSLGRALSQLASALSLVYPLSSLPSRDSAFFEAVLFLSCSADSTLGVAVALLLNILSPEQLHRAS